MQTLCPQRFCETLTLPQTKLLDTIPSTPQHIKTILRILLCFWNAFKEKTKPGDPITKEEGNEEDPSDSGYG
jgi:hypothetical protein